MTLMELGDIGDQHRVGDEECDIGWCDTTNWPVPCGRPGCDGLVHASFGDEDWDLNYWLYTRCDVCGEERK